MIKYYHIVSDKSYWSVAEAKFVAEDSLPEGLTRAAAMADQADMAERAAMAEHDLMGLTPDIVDLPDQGELIVCLKYYKYPLGEFAGPDELIKQFEEAVAARLDAFAREKQYDNMDKARLAELTVDFKMDGIRASTVYTDTWRAAFPLIDQIRDGSLTVGDALDRLPAMTWPAA